MKLSAPVYRLKRKARLLSRDEKIPLHAALDRVAADEGFARWSLLASRVPSPAGSIYAQLHPGDLLLVGARPGHGKTLMGLHLAVEAMKAGNRGVFFTLEYTHRDIFDRFRALGVDWRPFVALFTLDASDSVSADYIASALADFPRGTLAVIDYLQLLDQKRENPAVAEQICMLKTFARERELILVFISQIDRSYDPATRSCPDITDIRLPNPLDVSLFDKTCFLHEGEVRFRAAN